MQENRRNRIDAFDDATWSKDERFYFESVDQMIRDGYSEPFSNGKPWHAVYIIESFLRKAEQRVRLFSGKLTRETEDGVAIYADQHVADAAETFLRHADSKLQIVLQEPIDVDAGQPAGTHPLMERIRALEQAGRLNGSCEVRRARDADLAFLREKNFLHHMLVMDDHSWRLEIDSDLDDVRAKVRIGDAKGARSFARVFDEVLFPKAEPLFAAGYMN